MRVICLTFISLFFFAARALGQDPQLKQLELTTSPAYVLLGVQPTNIQRPSTPRDFAATLQTAQVNGIIQPNFAVETNPFNWNKKPLKNKYSFRANDYFSDAIFPAIKKNFALSIATSATDTAKFGDLSKGTGIGYGMRVTLFPGTVNKRTRDDFKAWARVEVIEIFASVLKKRINKEDHVSSYEDVIRTFDETVADLLKDEDFPDYMKPWLLDELTIYKGRLAAISDKSELNDLLTAEIDTLSKQKEIALDRINNRKAPFARDGFILEFAAAGLTVMQGNAWDSSVYAKTGVWLTPSYRIDLSTDKDLELVQSFDILGVLRYIWNARKVDQGNYLDFGAKVQFNRNDWSLGFEGVFRHASEVPEKVNSKWTYSWVGNFSYTIEENITLRLSFGSQFDGNTRRYTSPGEILAIGGVNFGFWGKK
jgi:hypothetical protein